MVNTYWHSDLAVHSACPDKPEETIEHRSVPVPGVQRSPKRIKLAWLYPARPLLSGDILLYNTLSDEGFGHFAQANRCNAHLGCRLLQEERNEQSGSEQAYG